MSYDVIWMYSALPGEDLTIPWQLGTEVVHTQVDPTDSRKIALWVRRPEPSVDTDVPVAKFKVVGTGFTFPHYQVFIGTVVDYHLGIAWHILRTA